MNVVAVRPECRRSRCIEGSTLPDQAARSLDTFRCAKHSGRTGYSIRLPLSPDCIRKRGNRPVFHSIRTTRVAPTNPPDSGTPVEQCRHGHLRSEEPTSELQSLMRISYAVFCLKNTINN